MGEASRSAMLAALWLTVRGGLAGVRVHGRLPAGPVVWAANHHSWCDPFIAGTLLTAAGHRMVPRSGVRHERRTARRVRAHATASTGLSSTRRSRVNSTIATSIKAPAT